MTDYTISVEQANCFNENIKYILEQTENNLNHIDVLKNNLYFEMSKTQIISSFKRILSSLKKWQKYFSDNDIYHIKKEYKGLESDISATKRHDKEC